MRSENRARSIEKKSSQINAQFSMLDAQDSLANSPKIALVHNWLTIRGGSEKVLFELHKMYPDAPIYTLVCNIENFPELADADIRTSWLQHVPWLKNHHELFPPLRYFIWRFTKVKGYEIVLTNCSSENKAVRVIGGKHIAYIHTPPHYYWRYFKDYLAHPGFGKLDPFARIGLRIFNPILKYLDKKAAANPDLIFGNSNFICGEIKKYYDRNATTLYPPVEIDRFTVSSNKKPIKKYYLAFGRQTVFKKFNLIIDSFINTDKTLLIVGDGPEHENLVKLANGAKNIIFKVGVSDPDLAAFVQGAQACIYANEEDFGITWVESMAAGTPVICYGSGGALETVINKKTGLLFKNQTVNDIKQAIDQFENLDFDKKFIKSHAQKFSTETFRRNIQKIIAESI